MTIQKSVLIGRSQSARQPSFSADKYFWDYCFALNQMMQEKTGQAESAFILHRLA
jgi:hypothetical protein